MRRAGTWMAAALLAAAAACGSRHGDEAPAAQPPPATPQVESRAAVAGEVPARAAEPEPTDIPPDECPLQGDDARDLDKLLDAADAKLTAGEYAGAAGCAEVAADIDIRSVEAWHLRASALAALERYAEAELAWTMALAIDPDDPETLVAAAHFYINVLPPKTRESTRVGLEHARRGAAKAASRRRKDRELRARLSLLQGQALNDLARSDEALIKINEAIALQPSMVEARYERGVALFDLCRFEEAAAAFAAVLRDAPDDPYAHYHLGLVYERDGRDADARAHFEKAWKQPGGEFWPPVDISADEFRAEVQRAITEAKPEVRALLEGVSVEIADLPAREDLLAVDPPFAPTILGLFRGLPRGADPVPGAPPRAIVLYRKNLARAARARDELNRQIRRTLLHEIGHVAGLDEDELRRRGLE
ncbi:MAG TPA: metallopeptidase family protein [Kofleriaceae bacterium]|nr:metallopeptidase family protein [Kofleriaceae bacterium]